MIEVECQISIKKDGTCFLGPVKTELLNEIRKSGSLSSAAKNMKISYQHVWTMIDEMNRIAPEPLVIKQRGGTHGGGTAVSGYGERLLRDYQMIQAQIKKMVDQINVEINL
ncbi:MAG: winged helix-turn-helix domain-containing protein [Prolixibacteraceae bacterium]|jgi:molybdate transport system regulatory protein|nr:winged helix-turn-helix domain-containing protein [Prolixibacteraceae bacterium]